MDKSDTSSSMNLRLCLFFTVVSKIERATRASEKNVTYTIYKLTKKNSQFQCDTLVVVLTVLCHKFWC